MRYKKGPAGRNDAIRAEVATKRLFCAFLHDFCSQTAEKGAEK